VRLCLEFCEYHPGANPIKHFMAISYGFLH
jgi:hypothetical protein